MHGLMEHRYLEFPVVAGELVCPMEMELREAQTLQAGKVDAGVVLGHLRGVCEGRWKNTKRLEVEVGGRVREFWSFSDRMLTYGVSSVCVRSGLPISFFGVEVGRAVVKALKPGGKIPFHLNGYAVDPLTEEPILMTSDHIKPKSLGGPDKWWNRQAMLIGFNAQKAAQWTDEDERVWEERRQWWESRGA